MFCKFDLYSGSCFLVSDPAVFRAFNVLCGFGIFYVCSNEEGYKRVSEPVSFVFASIRAFFHALECLFDLVIDYWLCHRIQAFQYIVYLLQLLFWRFRVNWRSASFLLLTSSIFAWSLIFFCVLCSAVNRNVNLVSLGAGGVFVRRSWVNVVNCCGWCSSPNHAMARLRALFPRSTWTQKRTSRLGQLSSSNDGCARRCLMLHPTKRRTICSRCCAAFWIANSHRAPHYPVH